MNKFGTLIFLIVLLLSVGNVYSIDHSLGSDLEIKQSVVDKMKKEKFTYSYKEIKNKRKDVKRKYGTFRGKIIHILNKIEKGGEKIKTTTERTLDNMDKKKASIYLLVGLFVFWYIRRVIKNSFFNNKKINIYFKESNSNKKYEDLSYPYYDSTSYLSDNNQFLSSYDQIPNEFQYPSAQPAQTKKSIIKTPRFFSQRKRKNSDDANTNLFNYAYV